MKSRTRRLARHLTDRVLGPYFDQQLASIGELIDQPAAGATPAISPILTDFNHLLHELRTVELRRLPVDHGVLLSAGCAGRWYFDWIDDAVGPLRRHIGVELFSPRPDDLPPHVEWIAASASSMPAVASGSVDTVFSGQNLEHLWIDDMIGFFTEAHRVLRTGGALVIDSPNRLATEGLGWVHPQHTIEMTVAEAKQILSLAGFDVAVRRGLWNCRAPDADRWIPLQPGPGDVAAILDRAAGRFGLDDSFSWWLEAVKVEQSPQVGRLRDEVTHLFETHWTPRVNRAATVAEIDGKRCWVTNGFPIFAGRFSASAGGRPLRLRRDDGIVLAEGAAITGSLDAAEFGVRAEVEIGDGEHATVEVDQQPRSG